MDLKTLHPFQILNHLAIQPHPDEKELIEKMVEVICKLQPDCVMTVNPYLMYEANPIHRKVGMAALEACLFSSTKHFPLPDQDNHKTMSVKAILLRKCVS